MYTRQTSGERKMRPRDHMSAPYTRISCCGSTESALLSTTRTCRAQRTQGGGAGGGGAAAAAAGLRARGSATGEDRACLTQPGMAAARAQHARKRTLSSWPRSVEITALNSSEMSSLWGSKSSSTRSHRAANQPQTWGRGTWVGASACVEARQRRRQASSRQAGQTQATDSWS